MVLDHYLIEASDATLRETRGALVHIVHEKSLRANSLPIKTPITPKAARN